MVRTRIEAAAGVTAVGAISIAIGLWALASAAWTITTVALFAIEASILLANLDRNRASDGQVFPSLGAANWTTMLRGCLLAAIGGFVASELAHGPTVPSAWLPAGLYAAALVLDWVDGFLARTTRRESLLGRLLEDEYDSIGVLVVTVHLAVSHRAPSAILIVGLARYLFVAAAWIRARAGGVVHPLRHSQSGRVVAGLTMGYLCAALWPFIPVRYLFWSAPIFLVPFAGSFTRDWLAVSGRIDVTAPGYVRLTSSLRVALFRVLPMLVRVTIAVTAAWYCTAGTLAPAETIAVIALALAICLGAAARTAALALVVTLAVTSTPVATVPEALLVVGAMLAIVCGSGPLSLWSPEARLFEKRGAK